MASLIIFTLTLSNISPQGSQHWKKKPALAKNKDKQADEKRKVMFDEGTGEKKERKKAVKKDRVFIDFTETPE